MKKFLPVLLVLLTSTTGCGDPAPSDAASTSGSSSHSVVPQTTLEVDTTAQTTSSESSDPSDPSGPSSPGRYVDCGALPVQEPLPSYESSSPIAVVSTRPFGGKIDPQAGPGDTHYWTIELEPGEYRFVSDIHPKAGAEHGWFAAASVDQSGKEQVLASASFANMWDATHRTVEIIRIATKSRQNISVQAGEAQYDYAFAWIPVRDPIPAPTTVNCVRAMELLQAEPLSINFLDQPQVGSRKALFRAKLSAGSHRLKVNARSSDSAVSTKFKVDLMREDGVTATRKLLYFIDDNIPNVDPGNEGVGVFTVDTAGQYWIFVYGTENLSQAVFELEG